MQPVERADYEGVDYGWVMQTTFVVTILLGAPIVAVLSVFVTLDTWGARAAFAVRVGAPIWFLTAVVVAIYAKRTEAGDGASVGEEPDESTFAEEPDESTFAEEPDESTSAGNSDGPVDTEERET